MTRRPAASLYARTPAGSAPATPDPRKGEDLTFHWWGVHEAVSIGGVMVSVEEIRGGSVRLGIGVPPGWPVVKGELAEGKEGGGA